MLASFRRRSVLILLLLAAVVTPSRADVPRRVVLATGDDVPDFGAIGTGGFDIKGLTDDGRLIVAATLSDGRQGVYFAAHRQLNPIWTSDRAPGVTVDFFTATAQTSGAVLLPAQVNFGLPFFYVFTPAGEVRVVHLPSTDRDGNTLCYIDAYHSTVNTRGDVAFQTEIAPPGRDCESYGDTEQRPSAIYVARGQQITRAISVLDLSTSLAIGDWVGLIGLTDDDAVVASRHRKLPSGDVDWAVFSVQSGVIGRIVGAGDSGPSGAPLSSPLVVVANAAGDIAFTAVEGGTLGLYRTEGGRLIRVASPLVSPSGTPYSNIEKLGGFNRAGDIAFTADWSTPKDGAPNWGKGVVLYRAGGNAQAVFVAGRDTGLGRYAIATGSLALNDHGAVAFDVTAYDGGSALQALTWSEGMLDTALVTGDAGPDNTIVAEGGLYWNPNQHCLAPDGRVAAAANSTRGHYGLVCVDVDGPHLVLQSGTIAPDGFAFTDFADCSFTDDGALVFSASRAVPDAYNSLVSQASVYRASANGIERLFGDGDAVSNGTNIEDTGSGVSFVANAHGNILAAARAGDWGGLFLRHAGRLDAVSYGSAVQWGLTDSDAVVMISRLGDWRQPDWPSTDRPTGNAVLVWSGGRTRIVSLVDSAPASAFSGFTNLTVRGDLVLFTALAGSTGQPDRSFFYRIGDAEPREVPAAVASGDLLDFAPGGSILRKVAGGFGVLNPDGRAGSLVPDTPEVTPFGINDRGDIAIYAYANPAGSFRQTIEVIGPTPDTSARCPLPMTPPAGTPTSATPTPTPIATPVVGSGPYRAYVSEAATDTVAVVDTATQEQLASVMVSHHPTALAASPDGQRIFVLADSTVDIIDTTSLQVIRSVSLGESGASILAGADNGTAFVSTWASGTGYLRLIVIDDATDLVRSIVVPSGPVFGVSLSGGRLLATSTTGNSQSELTEIDPQSAQIVRRVGVGRAATSAVVSADGTRAYVVDSYSSQLWVVDLGTFTVIETLPVDQAPAAVAVTADGARAYTTHSFSSYSNNPDGSHTMPQGYLSAVDVAAGTFAEVVVKGGETEHLAVSPDGRLVYVTMSSAALGTVAVIDTQTNAQVATILPAAGASDVVVAPLPGTPAASPTPHQPQVIVRADSVAGIPGDDVPIAVRVDSQGLDVGSIDLELITTWNSALQTTPSNLPDCRLTAGVAAVASFEFDRSCSVGCDRVHVSIHASEPSASLPHAGILYTCTAQISDYQRTVHPILISSATAADTAGQPLPVFGADGAIRVLSRDDATPRPTRTRPPTATATVTPTATATMLPVMIEIGSATLQAGAQTTISVVVHTNGASVVGLQNEIGFSASAPIVAAATGKPQCTVNPTIGKPNTTFVFMPTGCDSAQGECTRVRALVVSFDDVNPIADQSLLYTCLVEAAPTAAVGTFALRASAVYASDANGGLLPAGGIDGSVSVNAAPPIAPSSTVTPTPANSPAPVATATPSPTITSDAGDSAGRTAFAGESHATSGGGCNVSPRSTGSASALAGYGAVLLASRIRRRVRRWRR